MRVRSSSHVRSKIIALLVTLAALWAFAAFVTVRDGLNLLFVNTLAYDVGVPTSTLVDTLQEERRQSVMALGGGAAGADLAASRQRTDEAWASWRESVDRRLLDVAATALLKERLEHAAGQLDRLGQLRTAVDAATLDRRGAMAAFTEVVDAAFGVYGSISSLDDQEIARQSRVLVTMSQVRELLSRQDALLAGALAAGTLDAADLTEFTQLVGTERHLLDQSLAELPPEDLALFERAIDGPAGSQLRGLQDQVVQARHGAGPDFAARTWDDTVTAAMADLRDAELAAADNVVARATPAAVGVIVRLLLAGGLGLLAVIAAIVISITTTRSLIQQLERLRDAARDLAGNRLPRVVERLSQGEEVDVRAEAPPLRFGADEIGQVGHAFNSVQETAVQAAVQQAELRRGVRDVFLSLARRTQGLVHKQLSVLDAVERRVHDPDEMEELFRIDHLATRMRRNAENLIVLAGATSGRAWRQPVPMIDVLRGALGEVEDYTRVNLLPIEDAALEGRVVGDVIHLLAELIENAASFSPPYAPVTVSGQRVARGFAVEIEDRGLGMSEEDLVAANRSLADPPDFSLADASRLGHYVVAKLAQRHGIKVHLRPSPYGGIAAIVLLPAGLLADLDPDQGPLALAAAGHSGGPVAGRTPSGLPWRVRQASLPQRMRQQEGAGEPAPEIGPDPGVGTADRDPGVGTADRDPGVGTADRDPGVGTADRDPEAVWRMMRAYQRGTRLGRGEANGRQSPGSDGAGRQPASPTPNPNDSQEV
jgi:methyl-accepting chemotaxis protein